MMGSAAENQEGLRSFRRANTRLENVVEDARTELPVEGPTCKPQMPLTIPFQI